VASATPDWDELQGTISGDIILPGAQAGNRPLPRHKAVVLCEAPEGVSETISVARRSGLRTATRSGGHCSAGGPST
jgi:FAD/FMN-containing dehydrogenase